MPVNIKVSFSESVMGVKIPTNHKDVLGGNKISLLKSF